jgi:hypothetical protein
VHNHDNGPGVRAGQLDRNVEAVRPQAGHGGILIDSATACHLGKAATLTAEVARVCGR